MTGPEKSEPVDVLPWVVAYLESDEEIVVPIKKMWNEWHGLDPATSLEEFTALVLADDQVEAMGEVDHEEDMDWMSPEELDEYREHMEATGYYSGPRVKLKARQLTLEHVARMISRHNDRMEAALQAARDSMPADIDEQEESALIHVIEMAKELRRKLREAGLEVEDDEDDAEEDSGG
jgi:hypothetical protein